MKLNPDCIRAILLAVEEVCDMNHYFDSCLDLDKISGDFSQEEIFYHARQCDLAGFFYNCNRDLSGSFSVFDLSPAGHEFLANIREDGIWTDVKAISAKVGSKSLSVLTEIASGVVTQIIKSRLGLP